MQDAGLRREKDVLNDETIQMLSLVCPSGEWRDIIATAGADVLTDR